MKRSSYISLSIVAVILLFTSHVFAGSRAGGYVHSYTRADGTHVSGYYRGGSYYSGGSSSSDTDSSAPASPSRPIYYQQYYTPTWAAIPTPAPTPTPPVAAAAAPSTYAGPHVIDSPENHLAASKQPKSRSYYFTPSQDRTSSHFYHKNGTVYLTSPEPSQTKTSRVRHFQSEQTNPPSTQHRSAFARWFGSHSAPSERDSRGRLKRSSSAKEEFMRSTGYPHGRPGYVIDHVIPLAKGGADAPSNMQWQTIAEGKAKDKWERR